MKLGLHIDWCKGRLFGRDNNLEISVFLPNISLGYIEYVDMLPESNWDDDSKWFGFKLNLMTNISFESYEYGKIFTFAILGLGFRISKYNIKIQ